MIVTPNNIKECHINTLDAVHQSDYYINLLPDWEPETTQEIITYWNKFWNNLPDNKCIRRDPFYQVCDIAECMYDRDFYEDNE